MGKYTPTPNISDKTPPLWEVRPDGMVHIDIATGAMKQRLHFTKELTGQKFGLTAEEAVNNLRKAFTGDTTFTGATASTRHIKWVFNYKYDFMLFLPLFVRKAIAKWLKIGSYSYVSSVSRKQKTSIGGKRWKSI